jgi:hypothetical protein
MLIGAMHDAMAAFGQPQPGQLAPNPFAAGAGAGAAPNPFAVAAGAGASSGGAVARDLGSLVRKRRAPANEGEAEAEGDAAAKKEKTDAGDQ